MVKATRLNVSPVSATARDAANGLRIADLEARLAEAKKIGAEAVAAFQQQEERYVGHCREMQATIDRAYAEKDAAQKAERAAVKAEADTRGQFDDLKRRLHEAEIANARLKGYLDRVVEDDTAREEPRVITQQSLAPRRPPPLQRDEFDKFDSRAMCATDGYARPKHWTGY